MKNYESMSNASQYQRVPLPCERTYKLKKLHPNCKDFNLVPQVF